MNITFLGNCQAPVLAGYLSKFIPVGSKINVKSLKPVHLLTHHTDSNYIEDTLSNTDVIVTQPLINNYAGLEIGTEQLKSRFKNVITLPNCYFSGYHSSFFYLKKENKTITSISYPDLLLDYHDATVMTAYKKGYDAQQLSNLLNETDDVIITSSVNSFAKSNIQKSITELRSREVACDIIISDFISDNYEKKLLFYTFNHPEKSLIEELIKRLLCFLNVALPSQVNISEDPFSRTQLPIHRVMKSTFSFHSSKNERMMKAGNIIDTTSYVKLMYEFYSKNKDIYNQNIEKAEEISLPIL